MPMSLRVFCNLFIVNDLKKQAKDMGSKNVLPTGKFGSSDRCVDT